MADEAARQGALDESRVPNDIPRIPMKNFRRKYREAFRTQWQIRWANGLDCRQTKLWMPRLSLVRSNELLHCSRKRLSILVQLLTGHNFLQYHESLVNGTGDDNDCRLCLEEAESSHHIMAECPALAEPRLKVFGATTLDVTSTRWTTKEIVSFLREASIDSLLDPNQVLGPGPVE